MAQPPPNESDVHLFLSAGEPSGDHYGAEVISALRQLYPHARFSGLGGPAMERAGQRRIVRADDVAVMGITEILRHIPRILGAYRRLVRALRRDPPSVALLIDFPDVNFRLARHLRRLGVPVVWFASPQLWAWKRRRIRWVQTRVDRMLVLFPFEERFYRARGVAAEFVGHPFASLPPMITTREQFAARARDIDQKQWNYAGPHPLKADWATPDTKGEIHYPLQPNLQWIALLPGSRISEIRQNLPAMIEAAYNLAGEYEFIVPIASTITDSQLAALQYDVGDLHLGRPHPPRVTFVRDAAEALHHARAAVVASGTATVLAAAVGTPFVVVYRVSPLTFAIARRLVSYPPELPAETDRDGNLPVAMVNLLAGRRIVPELLNQRFTAANIVAELTPLLADGSARSAQLTALAAVRRSLHPASASTETATGTARVAQVIVELLNAGSSPEVQPPHLRV